MNKKITLDDGIELVILNELEYSGKTYLLTDEIKNDQVQNRFDIFEKIQEDESYIEPIQDIKLKSEIAKIFKTTL